MALMASSAKRKEEGFHCANISAGMGTNARYSTL